MLSGKNAVCIWGQQKASQKNPVELGTSYPSLILRSGLFQRVQKAMERFPVGFWDNDIHLQFLSLSF